MQSTSSRPKKGAIKNDIESSLEANFKEFDFKLKKREFKFTDKQKSLIELINREGTKIVLIEGPAGTSKSIIGVYCGLMQLKEKRVTNIMYLRSVVESAQKSMGYLPGSSDEKLSFFTAIVDDKLSELVEPQDISGFHAKKKLETMPLNYIRGCSWRKQFILADEAQNYNLKELLSTMTRIGEGSVMVICGDRTQSDINNSGFGQVIEIFDNDEARSMGIHTFQFTEDDIVRSEIVKFIVKMFKSVEKKEKV